MAQNTIKHSTNPTNYWLTHNLNYYFIFKKKRNESKHHWYNSNDWANYWLPIISSTTGEKICGIPAIYLLGLNSWASQLIRTVSKMLFAKAFINDELIALCSPSWNCSRSKCVIHLSRPLEIEWIQSMNIHIIH